MDFIGATFRTDLGKAFLPIDRREVLVALARNIRTQAAITACRFLQLLGFMATTTAVVQHALLFMRPLQLYLLAHWRPGVNGIDESMPIKHPLRLHLLWWCKTEEGVPFQRSPPQATLTSDASMLGCGATLGDLSLAGTWTPLFCSLFCSLFCISMCWSSSRSPKQSIIGQPSCQAK